MNIVVFDTETVGCNTQTLLNVGYEIVKLDLQTAEVKVLCAKDYLVSDLISNEMLMLNDMFVGADKYAMYLNNIAKGGAKCHSIKKIFFRKAHLCLKVSSTMRLVSNKRNRKPFIVCYLRKKNVLVLVTNTRRAITIIKLNNTYF